MMSRSVLTGIFFLAALGLGFFTTFPQWQHFQDLAAQTAQLSEVSGQFDQLIANRDNLLNLINSISKDNLDRLNQVLPPGAHASEFLVALETLTSQNSMALRRVEIISPEQSSAVSVRPGISAGAGSGAGQPRPVGSGISSGSAPAASLGPNSGVGKASMTELPFSIQIGGSYENFKKFLQSAESNLRLIDVEEIMFNTGGKDAGFDVSIKAKTYYQ